MLELQASVFSICEEASKSILQHERVSSLCDVLLLIHIKVAIGEKKKKTTKTKPNSDNRKESNLGLLKTCKGGSLEVGSQHPPVSALLKTL